MDISFDAESSPLFQLTTQLIGIIQEEVLENELKTQIFEIIYDNDLDEDCRVPSWILNIFSALIEKKVIEKTYVSFDKSQYGDILSFLIDLSSFSGIEYEYPGEYIIIKFDRINLSLFINRQGQTYYEIFQAI